MQVLVKQETARKHGLAISADEEQLRAKLEAIMAELNAPTQFKVRVSRRTDFVRRIICIFSSIQSGLYNDLAHFRQSLKLQSDIRRVSGLMKLKIAFRFYLRVALIKLIAENEFKCLY